MMVRMGGKHLLRGFAILCVVVFSCVSSSPRPNENAVSFSDPCQRVHQLKPEHGIGTGERVTFALANEYAQTKVAITGCIRGPLGYVKEWQAEGFTGRAGFAVPGPVNVNSLKTPSGSYSVSESFGRGNPGTPLPYHQVQKDSYWGGSAGPQFNNYFRGAGTWPDEPLWDIMEAGDYEQAAVINYNRPPDMEAIHGRTFAIFLHAGSSETWGCISTDLDTVTRLLRTAHPGDRIVMGVDSTIFSRQ